MLNQIPQQRISSEAGVASTKPTGGEAPSGHGLGGRVSSIWHRYTRLSVEADPMLTTVWVHGRCLDVSIYDRDWPESYRY